MTDRTHPDSGRIITSSDVIADLQARIVELEAQLEAVGAGGVQALSAAPKAAPQQEAQEPVAFRCLHEWDGLARTSMPPKYACKHCHHFFDAPPSPAPQREAQEPVAWMWQHEETGRTGFVDCWQIENGFQENNPQLRLVAKLYTAPQPAPAPLSDDTERLEWLLWKLPGDALRYVVGELADTSSGAEFRAAIDAALAAQGGKDA